MILHEFGARVSHVRVPMGQRRLVDANVRPNPAEPARPPESGRTRPSVRIRPNSDFRRPPESGRTQIWDGRPNPAELRFGTAVRIRSKNTFLIVNDLLDLKT